MVIRKIFVCVINLCNCNIIFYATPRLKMAKTHKIQREILLVNRKNEKHNKICQKLTLLEGVPQISEGFSKFLKN